MTLDCRDLEHVLESEDPKLRAAFEGHAASCATCRERLDLWDSIAKAAPELRENWESPGLWSRIESAMTAADRVPVSSHPPVLSVLRSKVFSPTGLWLVAAAAAAVLVLPLAGKLIPGRFGANRDGARRLLTEQALIDVQRNEEAYIESIERLSQLAEPALRESDSPLTMNYREKLALIDQAIAECRAQAESNPFNAHLRAELLSMYQEKQHTLETVLEETQRDL